MTPGEPLPDEPAPIAGDTAGQAAVCPGEAILSIDFAGTLSDPRLRRRPGDGAYAAQVIQSLHGTAMPPGWADAYSCMFADRWDSATADALPGLLRLLAHRFEVPIPRPGHLTATDAAQELAVDLIADAGDHPIPPAHAETIRRLKQAGFTLVLACIIEIIDRLLNALVPDDAAGVHARVDTRRYAVALDDLVTGLAASGVSMANAYRAELITLMAAAGLGPSPAYALPPGRAVITSTPPGPGTPEPIGADDVLSIDFCGTLSDPTRRRRPDDGYAVVRYISETHEVELPVAWADAYTKRFPAAWAAGRAGALPGLLFRLCREFDIPMPGAGRSVSPGHSARLLAAELITHFGDHPIPSIYRDVIRRLHAEGRTLVLACNTSRPHNLRLRTLSEADILNCFAAVVTSSHLGVSKPITPFFRQVADAVGADVSRLVHVGNSLRDDVEGALRAGARAVWVRANPAAASDFINLDAVHQLRAFDDLLTLPGLRDRGRNQPLRPATQRRARP